MQGNACSDVPGRNVNSCTILKINLAISFKLKCNIFKISISIKLKSFNPISLFIGIYSTEIIAYEAKELCLRIINLHIDYKSQRLVDQ